MAPVTDECLLAIDQFPESLVSLASLRGGEGLDAPDNVLIDGNV